MLKVTFEEEQIEGLDWILNEIVETDHCVTAAKFAKEGFIPEGSRSEMSSDFEVYLLLFERFECGKCDYIGQDSMISTIWVSKGSRTFLDSGGFQGEFKRLHIEKEKQSAEDETARIEITKLKDEAKLVKRRLKTFYFILCFTVLTGLYTAYKFISDIAITTEDEMEIKIKSLESEIKLLKDQHEELRLNLEDADRIQKK